MSGSTFRSSMAEQNAPQITTLSDISANMFAAFVLVLLMAAAAAASSGRAYRGSAAAGDRLVVERRPLQPGAMVRLLYDRRPGARGASIDLSRSTITLLVAGSKPREWRAPIPAAALIAALRLRGGGSAGHVRLYVFANDQYRTAIAAMKLAGARWREISIPLALRGRSGERWSHSFLRLTQIASDFVEFRFGLARLLQAGGRTGSGRARRALRGLSIGSIRARESPLVSGAHAAGPLERSRGDPGDRA